MTVLFRTKNLSREESIESSFTNLRNKMREYQKEKIK